MKSYPRGSQEYVSKNFQAFEFDCKCSDPKCDTTYIDEELIEKLQAYRDELGCSVEVTCGNRCPVYSADLKARGYEVAVDSQHEKYKAADTYTGKHTGEELEAVARSVGFKAVGVGRMFAHVDTRSDQDYRWTYSY